MVTFQSPLVSDTVVVSDGKFPIDPAIKMLTSTLLKGSPWEFNIVPTKNLSTGWAGPNGLSSSQAEIKMRDISSNAGKKYANIVLLTFTILTLYKLLIV
jgi:hypothetical protein